MDKILRDKKAIFVFIVENRGIKKRKCADASDKKPCSQPGNV